MNRNYVLAEWARATAALGAGRSLAGSFNADSVSRAYYAMNHAAKAALAVDDVVVDTHEGLKRMFGKCLVRTGAIEKEWAGHLHAGVDQRVGADYDASAIFTADHAAVECDRAGRFVERMRGYLLSRGLPERELAEVERVALNQGVPGVGDRPENSSRLPVPAAAGTEVGGSQSTSQAAKLSWKDKVKTALGIGDTPEQPPKAPPPAAGAAGNRGQRRDGPSR